MLNYSLGVGEVIIMSLQNIYESPARFTYNRLVHKKQH